MEPRDIRELEFRLNLLHKQQHDRENLLDSDSNGNGEILSPFYFNECRICQQSDGAENSSDSGCSSRGASELIRPCLCTDRLAYVHPTCLRHWIEA